MVLAHALETSIHKTGDLPHSCPSVSHELLAPTSISVAEFKSFLDHQANISDAAVGRMTSLGIAFGIAGTVFLGACGAAIKYISGKVEEERAKVAEGQVKCDR